MSKYCTDNTCIVCEGTIPDLAKAYFVHQCFVRKEGNSEYRKWTYKQSPSLRQVSFTNKRGFLLCDDCFEFIKRFIQQGKEPCLICPER